MRYVLPVAGAAVGFAVGGPSGAMWGWQLGAAAGSIVDPQTIKGPGIGDLSQQTSQAGIPRPIVFGLSQPLAGNLIASAEPRIVKEKHSGKGGPKVETESVFRTYAIRICEGPVDGVIRVWRNGILVFDATSATFTEEDTEWHQWVGAEWSTTSPSRNAVFLEKARFFLGGYDQLPSPDLETYFGVGTTPAHRGTCYMVVADEDLTDMRGAVPQWIFQVAKGRRVAVVSNSVLHDWEAGTDPRNLLNTHTYVVERTGLSSTSDPVGPLQLTTEHGTLQDALFEAHSVNPRGHSILLGYSVSQPGDSAVGPRGLLNTTTTQATGSAAAAGTASVLLTYSAHPVVDIAYKLGSTPGSGLSLINALGGDDGLLRLLGNYLTEPGGSSSSYGYANIVKKQAGSGGAYPFNQLNTSFGDGNYLVGYKAISIRCTRFPGAPRDGSVLISGSFKVLQQYNASPLRLPLNPCLEVGDERDTQAYWEAAYAAATAAGTMPAGLTYDDDYPVEQSWAYFYYDAVTPQTIPVVDIVDEIAERVGSTRYDASALIDMHCHGLTITNQYPAYTALQALGQIFMFDGVPIDGILTFVPRGGDPAETVSVDDMLDDTGFDFEEEMRQDSIDAPRVMHLSYFDVAGGLVTEQQTSERPGSRRAKGEKSLSSAVLMTATQAAQAIAVQHRVAIEELRGEQRFALPDKYLHLTSADVITVQRQAGTPARLRLTTVEIFDGFQQYVAVYDRRLSYVSSAEGVPATPPSTPPSTVVGPTLLVPLDVHILRDADDSLGLMYYVAVSGLSPAWSGARVELSYDGGANYVSSTNITAAAVMAQLLSELPDHPQAYPDETNRFTVAMATPNGALESSTLEGMMNGANLALIGDEFIQFADADETSEGKWEIGALLRGRKGSTTDHHAVGDRFMLIDRSSILAVPANLVDLDRTLTFRATSFGATAADSPTVTSIQFRGRSQTEREVGYLQAHRDGSDMIVSWIGTGRLGSGVHVAHGARFIGYRVTFDDGVNAAVVVETTGQSISQDVSSLNDPVTITVEQLNELTGAGPSIEVIA